MCQPPILQALFQSLAGTWALNRDLAGANANEPSGKCLGTATLTSRTPSLIVGEDGKMHMADAEMLYHETGEFHLPTQVKMPFSKKYIWRFNKDAPKISLWFTKPGTEQVDYLFHNIDFTIDAEKYQAHGTGGHLCVDDLYSTSYTFQLTAGFKDKEFTVENWETVHEVQGPKRIKS